MYRDYDGAEERDCTRRIIRKDIERDRVGSRLTEEAKERAVDFAEKTSRDVGGLNFGQLREIGIKHVTNDVFKD